MHVRAGAEGLPGMLCRPLPQAQQAVAFSAGISDDLSKVSIEAMVDAQSDGVHFTANVLGRCGL